MVRKFLGFVALFAACHCHEHRVAFGQAVSGAITGAVLDSTGAGVPGAKVTATNLATNVQFSVNANDSGYYNITNLIAGRYQVDVAASGFRPYRQGNVDVTIGTVLRIDVELQVGNLEEAVTVSDVAPLVRDDKVSLGGSISSETLHALPTLGRNPTALAKLQPGIIEGPNQQGLPSAGGTGQFSFSTNGQRTQLNNFLLARLSHI